MPFPTLPPTETAPVPERDIYTVARLNREAKVLLEGRLSLLWIEGEISNLARPASGHLYFSLKKTAWPSKDCLSRREPTNAAASNRSIQTQTPILKEEH